MHLGAGAESLLQFAHGSCVVICRTDKPKERRGKILFINAVGEITRERAQSFLTDENIWNIIKTYNNFKHQTFFSRVATIEEVQIKRDDLSIRLYVGCLKKSLWIA